MLPREGCLMRVFLGEADRHDGRPAFEAIVLEARRLGLAGATVLRGILGYGGSSRLHTSKVLALSEDLPIVIEIIDTRERLDAFLPFVESVVSEGLVTMERAEVLMYRPHSKEKPA
jgi:PII-like signaling protein